jgi:hypothetical protein
MDQFTNQGLTRKDAACSGHDASPGSFFKRICTNESSHRPPFYQPDFSKDAAVILILCGLTVLNWLPRLNGPIDLRWDAGVYYILGTSLAEGRGYKLLNEPQNIDAVQYPPLFPAIIAVHQWLLGTGDPIIVGQWLRLSLFAVFIFYILAVYLMIRNYLSLKYAFVATLICLFNLHTFFISDSGLPEILFGLATVLFVLFNKDSSRRINHVGALLGIVSYLLRGIGITLLAAWVAQSLFSGEFKRAAIRLTLALLPVLFWQGYISFAESRTEYKYPGYEYQRADYLGYNVSYTRNVFGLKDQRNPELGDATLQYITGRFLSNLAKIPTSVGEAVSVERKVWYWPLLKFPQITWWLVELPLLILGCLVLAGIGLQLARRQRLIPLYVLLSLATICLTPWPDQFNRYLVPLAPFLALSLFQTLKTLQEETTKILHPGWTAAGSVLSGAIILVILVQQLGTFYRVSRDSHNRVVYTSQTGAKIEYRLYFYSDAGRALDEGLDWLKRRAKPGDVVVSSTPHWVYLRTGLKSIMPPFEANPYKAQRLVESVPGSYLILNEGIDHVVIDAEKYVYPVVQKFADRWTRVYIDKTSPNRFEIYQRVDLEMP